MSQFSIRTRLLALAGVMAILWAVALTVTFIGFGSTRTSANAAAAKFDTFRVERDGYEGWLTQDDQSNMYTALASLHEASQRALLNTTWQQVLQGRNQATSAINAVIAHAPTARIRTLAQHTASDMAAYSVFTHEVHASVTAGHTSQAITIMSITNAAISNRTQSDFNALGAALASQATAVKSAVASTVSSSLTLLGVIAAVALLLGGCVVALVIRSITRPLNGIAVAAEQIAEGMLDVDVDVRGRNEIARMARAFQESVAHLQEMAGAAREIAGGNLASELKPKSAADVLGNAFIDMRTRVSEMIREIARGSENVSASAQQMASSSDETGRAIGEIAGAIESVASGAVEQVRAVEDSQRRAGEMAEASGRSANDARAAVRAADDARTLAREGLEAAGEASSAMEQVHASSLEASEAISVLGSKSSEIGGIVNTISEIAEQTNLLALNAAIEAARAGEQGRGFAVVAEEVRKLAEQSDQAAHSIESLILEIQTETGRAVDLVRQGAEQTADGVATVARTRDAFDRIGTSVDGVSSQIGVIAEAIDRISTNAVSVKQSLDTVASVAEQASASTETVSASTEQTSASTQEIAAGAQELASTAEQLKALVNQFVLA